ncbi:phosphotransferase [Pseudonocardia kujensis]|uniref:phosphotransferase n=1 Tax=Pseudonocardia kujensis TaxID=1128675 RepID=UPI001E37C371|nr:phosphotransferase [Pseudonocardia kujensis]MCE0768316.1 phosphotransferase [Pseudonocardia kujensis]
MTETPHGRAARALAVHAPEYRIAELRELGSGLDHHTFVVDGLVVRVAGSVTASGEADLLALVARRVPLPVPEPRFTDARLGVLAYPLLPGRPLLGRRPPPDAAHHLGRFLRALHRIEPTEVGDRAPVEPADPDSWLEDLDGPRRLVDVVRNSRPPAGRERVLAHADLGAEHILVDDGRISGVIDWADAAVTDPALDFARLYRDFGPAFLGDALTAYGGCSPELLARITYFARCAALEDLAYGHRTGREEYSRAAERSLAWLFPA